MRWNRVRDWVAGLDLQAKVVVVLFLVIAPTFLLVSLAVSQIAVPVVEEEMRTLGIHASRAMSDDILAEKLLQPDKTEILEQKIIQAFYFQPNVTQVDAFRATPEGTFELAASTEDKIDAAAPPDGKLAGRLSYSRKVADDESPYWEVWHPIKTKKGLVLGALRLEISLRSALGIGRAFRKVMAIAGIGSLTLLLVALSYFLRKTIQNDRILRQTESRNVDLSQQLREAERQLVTKEKLAVMGQLTASFAHEIGTPLNAVGGHLQLLQDELERVAGSGGGWRQRLGVITGQLEKIEQIVKGFLHNTAKPESRLQLMDPNQVMEKTLGIVSPRIDAMGVRLAKQLDTKLAPVRAVPLDIEQILLNLLNNSLDSLQQKRKNQPHFSPSLEVFSRYRKRGLSEWLELGVTDTGHGIPRKDLRKVFQPFFTTKAAGEGTGLGLPICQEIAGKYNGQLDIESKEGAWTRVTLRMPYGGVA